MQKSRMQHRKAVTLDTAVWPFSDTRVDKLEKDVDGILGDVAEIKEMVQHPNVQTRNDEHDDDADDTVVASQDHSVNQGVEKLLANKQELEQIHTEILEHNSEIEEEKKKFEEVRQIYLATLHQLEAQVEIRTRDEARIQEQINESIRVHGINMTGVSSTASQYCVNLTR